jgi:hypothetical protein
MLLFAFNTVFDGFAGILNKPRIKIKRQVEVMQNVNHLSSPVVPEDISGRLSYRFDRAYGASNTDGLLFFLPVDQ